MNFQTNNSNQLLGLTVGDRTEMTIYIYIYTFGSVEKKCRHFIKKLMLDSPENLRFILLVMIMQTEFRLLSLCTANSNLSDSSCSFSSSSKNAFWTCSQILKYKVVLSFYYSTHSTVPTTTTILLLYQCCASVRFSSPGLLVG